MPKHPSLGKIAFIMACIGLLPALSTLLLMWWVNVFFYQVLLISALLSVPTSMLALVLNPKDRWAMIALAVWALGFTASYILDPTLLTANMFAVLNGDFRIGIGAQF